jgi:hypothetical protein
MKIRAAQNASIKDVGLEGLQESERSPDADAKMPRRWIRTSLDTGS